MWAALAVGHSAGAANSAPLVLEAKIPLGDVKGRMDHMTVDLPRQRLFVAELGNDSVGVVDLKAQKVMRTITALKEPQGVGYVPSTDTLYVANGADGSVRLFEGANLVPSGRIELGDDADNVRVDTVANQVLVGYGSGAVGLIDAGSRKVIGRAPLKAHPESFQLESKGKRIFANVPDAGEIDVLDRTSREAVARWPLQGLGANFPLTLDEATQRVLVVFRHPATLGVFKMSDGAPVATAATCGDADDVFVDAKRKRVYVSCGEGFIDTFTVAGSAYTRSDRLATEGGARTSLFVPEWDRLFLAVRGTANHPAAIWVLRPSP